MTIGSIGATAGAAIMKVFAGTVHKKETEAPHAHHKHDKKEVRGASGFVDSLFQTLQQLSATTATAGSTAAAPADANAPPTGTPGVMQAVQSFFHSLFATLRQVDGAATGTAFQSDVDGDSDAKGGGAMRVLGFGRGRGGGLENKLQSLLATLTSGGSLPAVPGAEPLDKAFANLMSVMKGGGSAAGTNSGVSDTANLQTFLQSWMKNLQGNGTTPTAVGNIVNSTV